MTRRVIRVDLRDRNCALVRGYGARDLLIAARGRPPSWSPIEKAWACQQRTALDVVALAEQRGYEIAITGDATINWTTPHAADEQVQQQPAPRAGPPEEIGLW